MHMEAMRPLPERRLYIKSDFSPSLQLVAFNSTFYCSLLFFTLVLLRNKSFISVVVVAVVVAKKTNGQMNVSREVRMPRRRRCLDLDVGLQDVPPHTVTSRHQNSKDIKARTN